MALTVLVVEDGRTTADRLVDALSEIDGVEVVGRAVSEEDAVRAIRHADPDVVILDLRLAHGSGFGVLRRFASVERPHFVVFSNHSESVLRRRALELGADIVLDKATGFGSLVERVGELARPERGR